MLVLTRKNSESIIISESIQVTVLEIQGGRVKLGIQCDRSIPVRREELPEWNGQRPESKLTAATH